MRFFEPRGPQPRPSGGPQLVSLVRALRRLPPEQLRRGAALSSAARTFGATPAAAEDKFNEQSADGEHAGGNRLGK